MSGKILVLLFSCCRYPLGVISYFQCQNDVALEKEVRIEVRRELVCVCVYMLHHNSKAGADSLYSGNLCNFYVREMINILLYF